MNVAYRVLFGIGVELILAGTRRHPEYLQIVSLSLWVKPRQILRVEMNQFDHKLLFFEGHLSERNR
jgi:hypothetical protein